MYHAQYEDQDPEISFFMVEAFNKIMIFDSETFKVEVIFVDLVQKTLVGQNITTGPTI